MINSKSISNYTFNYKYVLAKSNYISVNIHIFKHMHISHFLQTKVESELYTYETCYLQLLKRMGTL